MNLITLYLLTTSAFNLPPGLLSAVCFTESRHSPAAIHHNDGGTNSRGLCQIKTGVAKSLGFQGQPKDLQEASTNVYYAAKLLNYQIKRCGSIPLAVRAYNSGSCSRGNPRYVEQVMKAWAEQR